MLPCVFILFCARVLETADEVRCMSSPDVSEVRKLKSTLSCKQTTNIHTQTNKQTNKQTFVYLHNSLYGLEVLTT